MVTEYRCILGVLVTELGFSKLFTEKIRIEVHVATPFDSALRSVSTFRHAGSHLTNPYQVDVFISFLLVVVGQVALLLEFSVWSPDSL